MKTSKAFRVYCDGRYWVDADTRLKFHVQKLRNPDEILAEIDAVSREAGDPGASREVVTNCARQYEQLRSELTVTNHARSVPRFYGGGKAVPSAPTDGKLELRVIIKPPALPGFSLLARFLSKPVFEAFVAPVIADAHKEFIEAKRGGNEVSARAAVLRAYWCVLKPAMVAVWSMVSAILKATGS